MKNDMKLRSPQEVMSLERLGSMHSSRLSFTRTLMRKIAQEKWVLKNILWDLDDKGFGDVIYQVRTPHGIYHLVIFANYIKDEERNDRVIANKWDVTFTFVNGEIDSGLLTVLKENVPLQEAGRNFNNAFVLARANKSVRIFEYIVNSLANGKQPDLDELAKVGYILRTTAVYGSGKFGISDFDNLQKNGDFSQSFSAEMCAVYIVRQFSLDWVNYIAKQRGGDKAVELDRDIQRYLGVGNATGLGMAPYLIKHPKVVDNWLYQRELALSKVMQQKLDMSKAKELIDYLKRASLHLKEITTIDSRQDNLNKIASSELSYIVKEIKTKINASMVIEEFVEYTKKYSLEAQEIVLSCLLELYPELVDIHDKMMTIDETPLELTGVKISEIKNVIEKKYDWALGINFENPENNYWFWYISEEKEEPRLGVRGIDNGDELEQPLDIARQVVKFYNTLKNQDDYLHISKFLLENPCFTSIARRVWTMGNCVMGDIRANVLAKDFLPMHLLRAKLSMFGATKYDPRSDRWVQVTLFQNAPLMDEIHANEWMFPLLPKNKHSVCDLSNNNVYVSKNELKAACIKAYNGLKLNLGEADLIASMVIDMQMAGLNGLSNFLKAAPYLKSDNLDTTLNITNEYLSVDLNHHSILCHIQIIIAYALDFLNQYNSLNIKISKCYNRCFVYSQLKRLSNKNLYVKAYWYDIKQSQYVEYFIKNNEDFPDVLMKNIPCDLDERALYIEISKNSLVRNDENVSISHDIIEKNYEESVQKGILLQKKEWEELLKYTKGIMVQSSEQSRKDAGGVVEF
ncbi:TPA: DUF3726 domain-containing protein [Campylobacter lari]|uniref:DUF3726 domain-containing protein n=1 Tax=Campylobacter sp. FU_497 TaxID=2911610 RepID=UPI0021E6416C|nr:DUF3726 domain-containing protein [Campylobacter sp. FU_497]MCV3463062.1 DUF3726 domain-containing protein [Campylobacter sp. FU_497]HEC1758875.1 DUF3726 domain-containing protein [Campylobacter lari]